MGMKLYLLEMEKINAEKLRLVLAENNINTLVFKRKIRLFGPEKLFQFNLRSWI